MIPEPITPAGVLLALGLGLSILLPVAVVGVAVRGYRRSDGDTTVLQLVVGIILITAVPTLMRLGFGTIVPGGTWAGLVVRLTELVGLLAVIGVMQRE